MSGDWIKMRSDLPEDPAVVRLAEALGIKVPEVVGHLHRIWSWADAHAAGGVVEKFDSAFLDRITIPGFANTLKEVGWLENGGGKVVFPRFDRHNGAQAKTRALDALRKRRERMSASGSDQDTPTVGTSGKRPKNVRVLSGKCPEDVREASAKRPANVPPDPSATEHSEPQVHENAQQGMSGSDPDQRREEKSSSAHFVRGSVEGGGGGVLKAGKAEASNEGTPGSVVWEAYASAYRLRWGVTPARNATANSLCKRFAALIPADEAAEVVRFYCRSPRAIYVQAKHPLELAVRDAQALRTEWLRGEHGTDAAARQGDRTAARGQAFRLMLED